MVSVIPRIIPDNIIQEFHDASLLPKNSVFLINSIIWDFFLEMVIPPQKGEEIFQQ